MTCTMVTTFVTLCMHVSSVLWLLCDNMFWVCNSMHSLLYIYFAAITVGYVETAVNVSESDGVAQLTVGISMPPESISIETSFFLLVNTDTGLFAMECEFG